MKARNARRVKLLNELLLNEELVTCGPWCSGLVRPNVANALRRLTAKEILREMSLMLRSGNAEVEALTNVIETACKMKNELIARLTALGEALMKNEVMN